jgi:predicted ABC-type ATPase
MDSPRLYIIAGPNGSGKTTFVQRFLPIYADCINFVNADLIASGLSPFSPEIAERDEDKGLRNSYLLLVAAKC